MGPMFGLTGNFRGTVKMKIIETKSILLHLEVEERELLFEMIVEAYRSETSWDYDKLLLAEELMKALEV